MIRRFLMLIVLAALAASVICAQPDPNQPKQPGWEKPAGPNPGQPGMMPFMPIDTRSTAITVTPNGAFVVRNGILARFDAATLEAQGTLELLGPMPDMPAMPGPDGQPQPNAPDAMMKWNMERMRRTGPVTMLTKDDLLLIILADTLFKVDQKTFKTLCKVDLSAAEEPKIKMAISNQPVVATVFGNLLYVLRNNELLVVDLVKDTLQGRGKMPKEMMQQMMMYPPGIKPPIDKPIEPLDGPGAKPREMTIVGQVQHVELEGGFWTIKNLEGAEYVLEGEQLAKLTATPDLGTKRVRIIGTFSTKPGVAQYGKGCLSVREFQVIEREAVREK